MVLGSTNGRFFPELVARKRTLGTGRGGIGRHCSEPVALGNWLVAQGGQPRAHCRLALGDIVLANSGVFALNLPFLHEGPLNRLRDALGSVRSRSVQKCLTVALVFWVFFAHPVAC